jgi:terminase small subunit-like protein
MASPYAQDAPRLKAAIVARAEAGEFLNAICASPGMPCVLTVRHWSRTDPLFGEALAAARRRGEWRRLWVVDEPKAAAFLARARAGEPIRSLLGQPGMPSQTAYRRWKIAQAPFAEAAFALLRRRDVRGREWGRARRRDFDPKVADQIIARLNTGPGLKALLAADPELPSREIVARWRREQPQFDRVLRMILAAKRRAMPPAPEVLVDEVVEHIVTGGTFLSYSRLPGAPSYNTLRRWMRDPDFAHEVAQACEWREQWCYEQIEMVAEQTPPGPIREMERSIGPLKRQLVRLRHRPRKPLQSTPRQRRPAS